jgi:hypothetical protein
MKECSSADNIDDSPETSYFVQSLVEDIMRCVEIQMSLEIASYKQWQVKRSSAQIFTFH